MKKKIINAIISVSDKSNLLSIIKVLKKHNINIISSGGTFKYIQKAGYYCSEISKFTDFNEMLDGRVKTLHPKIHAGILFDRSKKAYSSNKKNNFSSIDLVIVNFYPFKKTLSETKNVKKIIENIDIGGPALVRAAAKNSKDVVIITDNEDYENLKEELKRNNGSTSLNFREMASKAFNFVPIMTL